MDLFAYVQIEDLGKIAADNGIEVPRLRGYRLMKDETPVTVEGLHKIFNDAAIDAAEHLCSTWPKIFNPYSRCSSYDSYTDYVRRYFITYENTEEDGRKYTRATGIKWDRLHGRKRKILKFEIRKAKKRIREQFRLWNTFCGRDDVLYIHAKLGDCSWANPEIKKDLKSKPWFLGCVDDWWDGAYCDFYAKIDPSKVVRNEGEDVYELGTCD